MSGQFLLPRVAARVFDTPLMVAPQKMAAILAGFGARIVDGGISLDGHESVMHIAFDAGRPSQGVVGDRLGRQLSLQGARGYDQVGNVAVIPVEGTLVHKGAFVGQSSGETSYQGLMTQCAKVLQAPDVKGVVFEVDSFGGEVAGAYEAAAAIAKVSAAKPTMAILTDFALSSGYLMASGARQIVTPETGSAGGIGVIMLHADMSGAMDQKGVKVTMITSGAHKGEGSPYQALGDDVRAKMQGRADQMRDLFAATVGQARGKRFTKANALATEAQSYMGADALKAGLVDAVGSPSEAFAAFCAAMNRA